MVSLEKKAEVTKEVGVRARREAIQNAWARVVLVIVAGNKVLPAALFILNPLSTAP